MESVTHQESLRRRLNAQLNNEECMLAREQNYQDTTDIDSDNVKRKSKTSSSPYTIQNFFWLLLTGLVLYFTEFLSVILYDIRINRAWFNIGVVLVSVHITIGTYLVVFLSWVKKVPSDEWEQKHPLAVPVATFAFVTGGFCCMIGLWPVWGILTPFILFCLTLGGVVAIAMIP